MKIVQQLIRHFLNIMPSSGRRKSKNSAKSPKSNTLESTPNGSPETITQDPKPMKSEYHYLIDNGHGGWVIDDEHPEGYYPTSGKRSPKDPETGEVLIYEGVNNRINAKLLLDELTRMRISASLLVPEEEDISLGERVRRANKEHKQRKCILISIHSNAAGSRGEWANAKGNGLYISKNRSQTTDKLVDIMADQVKHDFQNETRWRGIKERGFTIITQTNCPAILTEFGFHDNLEEAKKMLTDDWRELVVKSLSHSIIRFEDS